MHDDVRFRPDERRGIGQLGAQSQAAVVAAGQLESGAPGEVQRPLGLRYIGIETMADVEQSPWVVVGDGRDPRHSRHPEQHGRREWGLVERGEDQGAIEPAPPQPVDEVEYRVGAGPHRFRVDPRRLPHENLVDIGK